MPGSIEEALRELFAAETDATRAVLAEPRNRNTPVKLTVRSSHRAAQTFLPVLQSAACKAGCSFCCRGSQVDVPAVEALTIARGFRETLAPEQLAIVVAHVQGHARAIRSMTLAERRRARTPCPMLDDASGHCAVYDARPMRCRAHHSADARDCEAASLRPDDGVRISRSRDVMHGHEAMLLGQRRALIAAKLDARSFELSLALEVALTVEDAAERWANGERIFDAAVFTWPDETPLRDSELPGILLGAITNEARR